MFVRSGGFRNRQNDSITTVGQKYIDVFLFFFESFVGRSYQYIVSVFIGNILYLFDNGSEKGIHNLRHHHADRVTFVSL